MARGIDADAQQPIGQHLTGPHTPEFRERPPGLKVLTVADKGFKLLQRHSQALEASDWIFHGSSLGSRVLDKGMNPISWRAAPFAS
jgi:hypothetical protein